MVMNITSLDVDFWWWSSQTCQCLYELLMLAWHLF